MDPRSRDEEDFRTYFAQSTNDFRMPIERIRTKPKRPSAQESVGKAEVRVPNIPMTPRFGTRHEPDFKFPSSLFEPFVHFTKEKESVRRWDVCQADEARSAHGHTNYHAHSRIGKGYAPGERMNPRGATVRPRAAGL